MADHVSKTWLVNDWEDIGVSDPFPHEESTNNISFAMPETPENFVYAEERLQKEISPYCIFVPRKEVMWKMMRACIGCKETSDLWIFQDEDHSRSHLYYTDQRDTTNPSRLNTSELR